jgi:hypothetical protein
MNLLQPSRPRLDLRHVQIIDHAGKIAAPAHELSATRRERSD